MIREIYNKPQLHSKWRITWTSIMFLIINYVVFVSFINVCFETLATKQPIFLIATALFLLLIDLILGVVITCKPSTIGNAIDVVVIFCLFLSFSLFWLFPGLVFLQIMALFKLHDTIYFNILVYNLLKKRNDLLKVYVVAKISYWVIMVGHILGCIFYAIDNYLIKVEYFGTLSQNPNLYYMGSQHCFTSLYSLSQSERYVYAIYYSFALLSTIAFGDIIGHNYFQDILVAIYLIVATIGISLIIEQMYIVFRRQKTMHYELISKLKYVSQFIKTQPKISNQFRHDLINYMVNAQWKQITSTPNLKQLTDKLQKSLFSQSILAKTQNPLPLIIRTHFMPFLNSKYYPANYFVVDNNRLENHLDGRIILRAKISVGYTRQLIGKQTLKINCISFGFDQLVIGTNCLHKYLTVQLVQQAQVFVLNDDTFDSKMLEIKNQINQYLPNPIEFYQISIDEIINKNQQAYHCSVCNINNHNLVDCPKFHYNPRLLSNEKLMNSIYTKRYYHHRKILKRKNIKAIKNTSKKSLNQLKQQKQGKADLAIHFKLIGKMIDQNTLFQNLLSKAIINYVQQKLQNKFNDQLDSYHVWKIYCPKGRL